MGQSILQGNGGGKSIEMGGFAKFTSWGNSINGTFTSEVLERPDGYSVQWMFCATEGSYYGDGNYKTSFQGSNDKSSWNTIASGDGMGILSGGGHNSNKNNAYKYYRFVITENGPTRGMDCMYLVKD